MADDLLRARLKWEAEHPRPESLIRSERGIVRALMAEGFGHQYQVTREDGFEIAVALEARYVLRDALNATGER